jgi:Pyruvate/2-oxoacid:ferredoxin oxidoreductase gamma subunit
MKNEDRIVELLAELLRGYDQLNNEVHSLHAEMQAQREASEKNTERMINTFNVGFTATLDGLDKMRQDMNRNHQEAMGSVTDLNKRVNNLEKPS